MSSLTTEWVKRNELDRFYKSLDKGDIVEFKRSKKYLHFGIFIGQVNGEYKIIHWRVSSTSNKLQEDTIENVLKSDEVRKNNELDVIFPPLSKNEIVKNARNKLKNNNSSYCLCTNNCENFVNECRYNFSFSFQSIEIRECENISRFLKSFKFLVFLMDVILLAMEIIFCWLCNDIYEQWIVYLLFPLILFLIAVGVIWLPFSPVIRHYCWYYCVMLHHMLIVELILVAVGILSPVRLFDFNYKELTVYLTFSWIPLPNVAIILYILLLHVAIINLLTCIPVIGDYCNHCWMIIHFSRQVYQTQIQQINQNIGKFYREHGRVNYSEVIEQKIKEKRKHTSVINNTLNEMKNEKNSLIKMKNEKNSVSFEQECSELEELNNKFFVFKSFQKDSFVFNWFNNTFFVVKWFKPSKITDLKQKKTEVKKTPDEKRIQREMKIENAFKEISKIDRTIEELREMQIKASIVNRLEQIISN